MTESEVLTSIPFFLQECSSAQDPSQLLNFPPPSH